MRSASRATIALLFAVLLVAGACGSDEPTVVEGQADMDEKPQITVPDGDPPDELVIEDIVEGDGAEAEDGSTVTVHYVGVSWTTGEEFDSSWDRDEPFPGLTLGQGLVIQGWDEGLVGMREGGRRQLIIPPDMAYGADSPTPDIAPNDTLIFVVDMLEVEG